MLVLTRKPGQSITLRLPDGRQIRVIVTKATWGQCRIGIDAPSDVNIVRDNAHLREKA